MEELVLNYYAERSCYRNQVKSPNLTKNQNHLNDWRKSKRCIQVKVFINFSLSV